MTETPPTVPEMRDDTPLLATKLHPPRLREGFVSRPRLVDDLKEHLDRGLVLVSAPAGFGKTSLLAEWAQRPDRPLAWLSLDSGDNDPVRFWRQVSAAMDRAVPGIAARVGPVGPATAHSLEATVTALINTVAELNEDTVLVFDDYHLIEASLIHDSVLFLLEHRPPKLGIVLACRADPPLPMALLRAKGELAELRVAQLRFTVEEAAALLWEAVGSDLDGDAVAVLAARTEGWAAGLQLAGLSLEGRSDIDDFIKAFSGTHRFVLDYLTEEALDLQPEAIREFLLDTSVLERLSGPLCDAVTGQTDSQKLLETIDRANLFLIPLDESRSWWRYHQLFADVLRVRLRQLPATRMQELHHKAAAWHERHGVVDDAVHHALGAGEVVWAARLVEDNFNAWLLRGETATVQRWLSTMPEKIIGSRPRLLLARAILAGFEGDLDRVEALLEDAETAVADSEEEVYAPSGGAAASALTDVPAAIALERAYVSQLRGDAEKTIAYASKALEELGESETMQHTIAGGHLGVAAWLSGRLSDAEDIFSSLIGGWLESGEPTMISWGCHVLGRVQQARADLDAAVRTYEKTMKALRQADRPSPPAVGAAQVGMATVFYRRGDLEAAMSHATSGVELCSRLAYTQPLADGLATLAWIRHAEGDPAGAEETIAEALNIAPGPEVADLLNPVPAMQARLLLAQGDTDASARWTAERGVAIDDDPTYPREPAYLVLARVLLERDQPDQALHLLDRLHTDAEDRIGSVIEIQMLRALGMAAKGEEDAAVAVLAKVLALAGPQGHIRPFVDEGGPMAHLLGVFVAKQGPDGLGADVPLPFISRLVSAFALSSDNSDPSRRLAVPGLVVPLTQREVEVLVLLAAGKRNREIADEIYVSLNTVKKHATHIFDKLGATNRTEAVTRARQLGLIP